MLKKEKSINHFFSGAIASSIKTVIGQPFDVINTNMVGKYKGNRMLNTCKTLFKEEGFSCFWRGTVPALYRLIPHQSIYFFCLNYFKNQMEVINRTKMNNKRLPMQNFIVGGTARSIAVLATTPLLVLKTITEYTPNEIDRNSTTIIKNIVKKQGLRGLFTGLNASLARNVPYGGLFFTIYSYLLPRINVSNVIIKGTRKKSSVNVLLCSACASGISHYLLHPFDVVRTRIMLQGESVGVMKGIKNIYLEEGLMGVWRGTLPKILKKSIATSIAWTIYDALLK